MDDDRPWEQESVAQLPPAKQLQEIERRLTAEYRRCQERDAAMLKVNIRVALQIDEDTYCRWLQEAPAAKGHQHKRRALLLKWQDIAERWTLEFASRDKKGSFGAFAAKAVYGYREKAEGAAATYDGIEDLLTEIEQPAAPES